MNIRQVLPIDHYYIEYKQMSVFSHVYIYKNDGYDSIFLMNLQMNSIFDILKTIP